MTVRFIYFIKPVGEDGPVKIGISARPEARIVELLEWSPVDLEIAHMLPGTYKLERQIQQALAKDHVRREWFRATPRIVKLLADLRGGKPIAAAIDLSRVEGVLQGPSKVGGNAVGASRRKKAIGASLTQGQLECLSFISAFEAEHGRVPTYQEIADGLGLHSKSGIHRYITSLEDRGRLTRVPGLRCGYQIVGMTEKLARAA